jgi:murein DD-endopeptidase MepM/ murein hydrolase activator NlpD
VVQVGDTLLDAALELGLNVDEVGCVVRPEFAPETQPLVIGDRLLSLPEGLICVRTQAGDTVRSLAERYSIAPEAILSEPWNGLRVETAEGTLVAPLDDVLPSGRFVRVPAVDQAGGGTRPSSAPGGFVTWMLEQPAGLLPQQALATGGVRRPAALAPVAANWPYGSGIFLWPSYGFLTQGYSFDHRALDIAAPTGAPVTAADRGVVVRAGWNGQGYGNFVVIDHNIDFMTLYAHLDTILVAEGDVVAQGQVLGTVGTSGNSTGPHLHFELRDFGRLTNPLEYLAR